MYRQYIDLAKKVFPNANIVVVQLFTRELNKLRINEMLEASNTKS
nr:hypothetical protein [uncultured Peptostreptococcus sp.]